MKKAFLISLLVIFSNSSFGQKIRFSDSTNKWTVFNYSCGGSPYYSDSLTYRYVGDTIVNDTTYRQLYCGFGQIAYVREDTIEHKVFTRSAINDTEKLLYDYTLNAGDSLVNSVVTEKVDSVDSIVVNGVWHKVWYFNLPLGPAPYIGYVVIEGIGCLNSPVYPLDPYFFEECTTLTCFNNRGITPLVSPTVSGYFDNVYSCGLTFGLAVKQANDDAKTAIVIPNPIDHSTKIVFPNNISSGSVTVFNDIGQSILNLPFQSKEEILIGDIIKVPGLYHYRVTDNGNGNLYSGKFIYR